MPAGRYAVLGDDGVRVGTEEFRCAPGPMGWRYFSDIQTTDPTPHVETFDVVVDADWRPVRIRVDSGEHQILLEPHGGALTGVRDGASIELPWEPDRHLDYFTPATNLITTRRLTDTTEIDVVYPGAGLAGADARAAAVRADRATKRWRPPWGGSPRLGGGSRRSPDGWTSDLWVAGDVVVRYDRLFELEWYDPGASGPRVID